MSNQEQHEYICSILAKLVPCSEITAVELMDLASALGIRVSDFYSEETPVLNVINWKEAA